MRGWEGREGWSLPWGWATLRSTVGGQKEPERDTDTVKEAQSFVLGTFSFRFEPILQDSSEG